MMNEPQNQDWSFVEHALEEGTCSGFKMAILESEKIFQQMVKHPLTDSGLKKFLADWEAQSKK